MQFKYNASLLLYNVQGERTVQQTFESELDFICQQLYMVWSVKHICLIIIYYWSIDCSFLLIS